MRLRRSLLLLFVILLGAYGAYRFELSAVDGGSESRVLVDIPSGSSLVKIADLLASKGVVRSSFAFRIYARLHGYASSLPAGSFVVRPSMNVKEVIETLTGTVGEEVTITVPEGYTVKDMDALLAKKGLIQPGELLHCAQTCDFSTFDFLPHRSGLAPRGGKLEGYLFPDTYFVLTHDFQPKFFLERLLGTFRKRVVDPLAPDIATSGHSLHEIVTMASLVEEESRRDDERHVIAGILWKRLQQGVPLGVDAAVRYIVGATSSALTKDDLDLASPYNLRKVRGLPPGPIASPGLASIRAALRPTPTPYLYYLHGADGVIHYAQTNDEHNKNRALYLP